MTPVTSEAVQKVGKGTAEKMMSLEMTARKLIERLGGRRDV